MAVNAVKYDTDLVLKVQVGTDEQGNPVYRQRRYMRVKPEASHEAVHLIGQTLANLQIHALVEITRQDDLRLEEVS